jgi:rhodanese-related sulfurtransferase
MTTAKDLVARANERVRKIAPDEAARMMRDENVLLVDVRDPTEVAKSGKLKGAVAHSRGMLEFRADPESPYHDPAFSKDKTVLVYCASGGRSALAGAALKDLGYANVYNIGGFKELTEAGLETEPAAS